MDAIRLSGWESVSPLLIGRRGETDVVIGAEGGRIKDLQVEEFQQLDSFGVQGFRDVHPSRTC